MTRSWDVLSLSCQHPNLTHHPLNIFTQKQKTHKIQINAHPTPDFFSTPNRVSHISFLQGLHPTKPLLTKPTRLHTLSEFNIDTQNDAIFEAEIHSSKAHHFWYIRQNDGCKTCSFPFKNRSLFIGHVEIFRWKFQDALWNLITYCAATGGSLLVIGSAAGVAFMGMASWMAGKMNFLFGGQVRPIFKGELLVSGRVSLAAIFW